jgi:hypothetical protein
LPVKKLGDLYLLLRLGGNGVLLFRLLASLMYHQRASLGDLHPRPRLGEGGRAMDGKGSTIKRYVPYPIGFRVHWIYADMYWVQTTTYTTTVYVTISPSCPAATSSKHWW